MFKPTRYLSIAVVFLALAVALLWQRNGQLRKDKDRYKGNTEALLSQIERFRVDSTTIAVDVKALRLSVDEYERYRAEDAAKIKQMGVKIRRLEAAARHDLKVQGPIDATVTDTIVIRDTIPVSLQKVEMITPHIRLNAVIEQGRLRREIHLPVTLRQAVWIEYKRRWIFWRKVKAIHQTLSSDNPYVEITYSEYIKIQK